MTNEDSNSPSSTVCQEKSVSSSEFVSHGSMDDDRLNQTAIVLIEKSPPVFMSRSTQEDIILFFAIAEIPSTLNE